MIAQAYVNQGRWVADCPFGDGGALELQPRQSLFPCPECHVIADIQWPVGAVWIWDALMRRPSSRTRNWAPAGHWQAIATGHPNGQSVADLDAETREHMEAA